MTLFQLARIPPSAQRASPFPYATRMARAGSATSCRLRPGRGKDPASPTRQSRRCSCTKPRSTSFHRGKAWRESISSHRANCACSTRSRRSKALARRRRRSAFPRRRSRRICRICSRKPRRPARQNSSSWSPHTPVPLPTDYDAMEAEILSKVIGCIYDAALDPDLWPTALEQACAFLTGCAAAIYSQDIRLKRGTRYHSWGDDPEFTRVYFTDYVRINPLVPHMAMQAVGGIYCASTLIPYEQLRASRFFKEWVAPQGLVDFVGTTLDKTATSVATVSFGRNTRQGLVDDEGRRRMALLAPHFRRAVLIDSAIDLQKSEVSALTDTFAGLASGVFLLGASGRLVFANPTGQAMLDEGAVLRVSQGAVAAVEPSAHAALREAVAGCASGGDAAVGLKGI